MQIVGTKERVIIRSWRVGVTKEVETSLSIFLSVWASDKLWPYDRPVMIVRATAYEKEEMRSWKIFS